MRHTLPILFLLLVPASPSLAGPPEVELVSPCLREGDTVRCWGDAGGGISLAPIPHLAGARDLVPTWNGVCGMREGKVVCLDERDLPEPGEAVKLSTEGSTRPEELLKVTDAVRDAVATARDQETACVLHRRQGARASGRACVGTESYSIGFAAATARMPASDGNWTPIRSTDVAAKGTTSIGS
jgi:hypothetical protein